MARRVYRVLLILALAALAGVTGWQVWSLDRTRTQQRDASELLQRDALRVSQALLDLRASQRAYLSPGQGITAWKPRVDAHLATLREHFNALREQASASSSPFAAAAAQADDEAMDALVAVRSLEQRIAEHVTSGRFQHAADLVYADGVRVSLTLERAAQAAFVAHEQDLQFGRTRVQWTEGALLALCAAIGFVLALLVMPASRAQGDAAETVDSAAAGRGTSDAAGVAAGATAAAAGRPAGSTGRRGEPAIQGLGLASSGRSATAGAGAMAGAGASTAGSASIPAVAARGGSRPTGAGRAVPAIAASGRPSSAPPPPAITMADDLPLHAPVAAFPSTAAQSASAAQGIAFAARESSSGLSAATGGARSSDAGPAGSTRADSTAAAAAAAVNGQTPRTEDGLLAAAAELTVSVARVGDLDGLKPVMARLAEHLDAVGLIVWLEDASTQRLTPIVTHGYPAETLAHLPPIDLDADNATARAWRLAELQIVPGRGTDPGAIVVPMPSSAGCVGVVAAEVRHGREHDPATLALARILAAQLAMLTGQRG
jgi:hypothetical protein